ncbi:GspH/FimT family protein [Piscinibacter sp.]|uniref:GspH/FimT family protein n=1 Tax=Piscinibacter sp. TaxID=1903157 RepID=UPI0039E6277E
MDSTLSFPRQRGFTLVEAGVVIAVLAAAVTVAVPGLQRVIEQRRLDAAATQLAATLQLARSESLARNRVVRLAHDAATGCTLLHTGAAGACRCTPRGEADCAAGAVLIRSSGATPGVSIQSNTASLAFDPQHGTVTPTATWRVVAARDGRAVHHVINLMGRVRSCSPNAAVPGYRAC